MLFKQKGNDEHFIAIGKHTEHDTSAPEVGKVYKAFDDGKIRWSRLDYWRIDEAINLDTDNVDLEIINLIAEEINDCFWLYSPEQHIIYKATMVDENGRPYTEPTECFFLRTKNKSWFGTGFLVAGLLDVDEYYYNKLLKEEQ